MKPEDHYHRFVRWSDEDQCYIGYCPDLCFGGTCHGDQEEATYAELCAIVRDEIAHRLAKGETSPSRPSTPPATSTSPPLEKEWRHSFPQSPSSTPASPIPATQDLVSQNVIPSSHGCSQNLAKAMHEHSTFQNFRFSVFQLLPKFPRLDAAIQNKYSRDPDKLAAWKSASRTERPAKKVSTPPPAP